MASTTRSSSLNNFSLDSLARATDGLCLISPAQEAFPANADGLKGETVTQELTTHITAILYPNNQKTPYLFTNLHDHKAVSKLLTEHEPTPAVDTERFKVILKHLKPKVPKVDNGEVVGILYRFIKTYFHLRQDWLKATGEFFALLAYVEVCQKQGLEDAGPSYPNQTVDFESQLLEIRERLGVPPAPHSFFLLISPESSCKALRTFKASDYFPVHMNHLIMFFHEIKHKEQQQQEANKRAERELKEDEKKRWDIKQRNALFASHQMGPATNVEMADWQQQRILDLMTDTMHFELGIEGGEMEEE